MEPSADGLGKMESVRLVYCMANDFNGLEPSTLAYTSYMCTEGSEYTFLPLSIEGEECTPQKVLPKGIRK